MPVVTRSQWARTNHVGNKGWKHNQPGAWVDTNGPVWWYGSDQQPHLGAIPAGYAAITRATSLICNRLASARWTVGQAVPRWVSDPMLMRPDERYPVPSFAAGLRVPRSVFWAQWIRSALSWGMGYLAFVEDDQGQPTPGSIYLLRPDHVTPAQDPGLRVIGQGHAGHVTTNSAGRFALNGVQWRLLELRNPTTPLDPLTGMAVGTLEYHAAELGLLGDITTYADSTFSSGVPSGYLKVERPHITQEQVDALRDQWHAAHGQGKRSTAILNATTSYQPISINPVDAALAEMKRLSLVDVANAYGVPGYLLHAPEGSSMTYSNTEQQMEALYEFTLRPWAVAIEETLSSLLPGTQALNIDAPGTGPAQPATGSQPPPVTLIGVDDSDEPATD